MDNLRHSASHLLAAAVTSLWPKAKPTLGPPIEDGFYYDFDFGQVKISESDLPKIEKEMHKIVKEWKGFRKEELSAKKAKEFYKDNPYKLELIDEFSQKGEKITLYKSGDFLDLCRGGHIKSPKEELKHFKLLSIAGAYWRGYEKNKMLTRIYGTTFLTQKELEDYLGRLEQAKMKDHRKIGKSLGIYLISDLVGPGLPLYTPKAGVIIGEIESFMRQLQEEMGYGHVYTPHLAKEDLYKISGHLQWFAESMYPPMEFEGEGKYYAKPMNCPFHIEIYKSKPRSYRDLPIRYAEFGTVYRYEKSGEISGLMRVRGFTQDDAHIFCREDQVVDEFLKVFEFTDKLLRGLGLTEHWHRFSLRGDEKDKYAGNIKQWEKATKLIRLALKKANINYKEVVGEAAFYGPKLDILFNDILGHEIQISTIQVDFLLPDRFNLTYIDKSGKEKQPYMIHRAPLGSRERIIAILLEHCLGAFPVWLSPVQVIILPISKRHTKYANSVLKNLKEKNIRVEVNDKNETLPFKIRQATLEKIPYIAVVGDKEEKAKAVALRFRSGEDLGQIKLEKFIEKVIDKIETKSLNL